jgi:hypothetical protein
MISIKKVEVTPIDRNIAKVVDSTATQDDKTKNTYSMRVIDNELDGKVDGQFLVNNYYSKTDIDEVLTSDEYVFTEYSGDGSVVVVFRRVGNMVGVYTYPTMAANTESLTIMTTPIELPDWAKISETSSDRDIVVCNFFATNGYVMSRVEAEEDYFTLTPSNMYYFQIVKRHDNGNYYFSFHFVQTQATEKVEKLNSRNTNYLVY